MPTSQLYFGHVGGDETPQGHGCNEYGDRDGLWEGFDVLKGSYGHVGGVGRSESEGGDKYRDREGLRKCLDALKGSHGFSHICRGSLWVLSSTSYLVTDIASCYDLAAFSDYHSQRLHRIDQTSQTLVSLYSGLPAGYGPDPDSVSCAPTHTYI